MFDSTCPQDGSDDTIILDDSTQPNPWMASPFIVTIHHMHCNVDAYEWYVADMPGVEPS